MKSTQSMHSQCVRASQVFANACLAQVGPSSTGLIRFDLIRILRSFGLWSDHAPNSNTDTADLFVDLCRARFQKLWQEKGCNLVLAEESTIPRVSKMSLWPCIVLIPTSGPDQSFDLIELIRLDNTHSVLADY